MENKFCPYCGKKMDEEKIDEILNIAKNMKRKLDLLYNRYQAPHMSQPRKY